MQIKWGTYHILEPMHITIPCVVHLHIKKYVSQGFKFVDPSFNTSFIKPLFILTAEVYFQDIEHMQGFWEIFHFDLHNFHYFHFDKNHRWVDKLDIQLQNGEILKSTLWILHNHFEQLHKKGWNNFILISDKVMNDEFWAKVIWVTQYKHWFYPCM